MKFKHSEEHGLEKKKIFSMILDRPVGSGGGGAGGSFSPPNDLLKFVDFVSEKGCKSQGRKNEDSNSYIFEESTRIYPNAISFDVIQVKNFKFSWKDPH